MFHGFGHTHKNMRTVEAALSSEYVIYNFDLFFHGFSEWNNSDNPLTHDYWKKILSAFMEEYKIEKFSLLGFSLGAKIALSTVEIFPDKIEELYLLAPDGLKENFWYKVATARFARKMFRYTILKPHVFYRITKTLNIFNLVDKSTLRFSHIQMNSRDKRRRVYYSWTVFKGIAPNLYLVIEAINQNKIHVELYGGRHDRIISPNRIQNFARKLHQYQLEILNTGHNNLLDEVASFIEREISKR